MFHFSFISAMVLECSSSPSAQSPCFGADSFNGSMNLRLIKTYF